MGLTIHYSLKAQGGDARAHKLIQALYQSAQELPFRQLGQVVDMSRGQCDFQNRIQDDALRWLLVQAAESVESKPEGRRRDQRYTSAYTVPPVRVIAFDTWPGEGCEPANFGLCQYPATIDTDRGPLKTRLSGWHWRSFCKTQYASDPKCGGVPHFQQCHLTVIAMLDRAKELGCLEEVSDEGGFWKKRNLPALVEEIGSWNEMIAAFGGKLKDLLGDGPLGIESAITEYPNFERLEAAGQSQLPPELQKLFALIGRVAPIPCEGAGPGRGTVPAAPSP